MTLRRKEHHSRNSGDAPSKKSQSYSDESEEEMFEASNGTKDVESLLQAINSSVSLLEVKSKKTATICKLALSEASLSVQASLHSAFVIAAMAALVCFSWILLNVGFVVFASEQFNSLFIGLALSLTIHIIGILACVIKLNSLKELIGFSRLKRILD